MSSATGTASCLRQSWPACTQPSSCTTTAWRFRCALWLILCLLHIGVADQSYLWLTAAGGQHPDSAEGSQCQGGALLAQPVRQAVRDQEYWRPDHQRGLRYGPARLLHCMHAAHRVSSDACAGGGGAAAAPAAGGGGGGAAAGGAADAGKAEKKEEKKVRLHAFSCRHGPCDRPAMLNTPLCLSRKRRKRRRMRCVSEFLPSLAALCISCILPDSSRDGLVPKAMKIVVASLSARKLTGAMLAGHGLQSVRLSGTATAITTAGTAVTVEWHSALPWQPWQGLYALLRHRWQTACRPVGQTNVCCKLLSKLSYSLRLLCTIAHSHEAAMHVKCHMVPVMVLWCSKRLHQVSIMVRPLMCQQHATRCSTSHAGMCSRAWHGHLYLPCVRWSALCVQLQAKNLLYLAYCLPVVSTLCLAALVVITSHETLHLHPRPKLFSRRVWAWLICNCADASCTVSPQMACGGRDSHTRL